MKWTLVVVGTVLGAGLAQTASPPLSSRSHSVRAKSKQVSNRQTLRKPAIDPVAVNNPEAPMPVKLGPSALRAQILLDREGFSIGEIDGLLGVNTTRAVAAFRKEHGLMPSEQMDQATWAALNVDTSPVIVSYTIADDDLTGSFVKIPSDMMEMAKLDSLGYASPLEELAERSEPQGGFQ
jgi:peptidoglycan hydrolase-like protein with peptidoglycan-binding domain